MSATHERVERMEKGFLLVTGVVLLAFLLAAFYAAWGMDHHLPGRDEAVVPTELADTPPFDEPGVREVARGEYEIVMLGSAWSFDPNEIHLPVGAEVTLVATATDVLHGVHVEGTRLNAMLVPGQITRMEYTFEEPGEYLMVCHEYCGIGHHHMYGRVIVE